MILVTAQTSLKRFDINANLDDHQNLIGLAANYGAKLILFPDLSITGYERAKAKELMFNKDDSRLDKLCKLANQKMIIVIAGAPIQIENGQFIGSFIIKPDGTVSIYTKQYLHTGEEVFFHSSFDYNLTNEVNNEIVSLVIYSDINNSNYPEYAKTHNTYIYLASIFFEPDELSKVYKTLSSYAANHSMSVLMSNFTGRP